MVFRRLINCLAFGLIVIIGLSVSGCHDEENFETETTEKVLFMYLPWSGNEFPLTSNFYTNVADMEKAIIQRGLKRERVIVFFSTSIDEAELYEIIYEDGKCIRKVLKEYSSPDLATVEGTISILNDVKHFAPALKYAMTIGCHGFGWIPSNSVRSRSNSSFKYHWEGDGVLTRWFGGNPSPKIDVTTLAEGLRVANMKMEFILFDDCYMAGVEVAYDLRKVTNYLIASTSEVMAYGMPYQLIGGYLLDENPDYIAICDHFYEFYSAGSLPYGTLSVIDCSQLDALAEVMNEINARYTFDTSLLGYLQKLDGYSPTIFYDMGDYVQKLCGYDSLYNDFEDILSRVVVYSVHTDNYLSNVNGKKEIYPIHSFSGLTISDPSTSSKAVAKTNTAWWKATHRSTTY